MVHEIRAEIKTSQHSDLCRMIPGNEKRTRKKNMKKSTASVERMPVRMICCYQAVVGNREHYSYVS